MCKSLMECRYSVKYLPTCEILTDPGCLSGFLFGQVHATVTVEDAAPGLKFVFSGTVPDQKSVKVFLSVAIPMSSHLHVDP